jgi:hypothetical protein
MKRNPLYSFRDRSSVGIFDVPLNSTVHILDAGPNGPIFVEIISKQGMYSGYTIGDFLDRPELYVEINSRASSPSELKSITNVYQGWGLLGRDSANYGPTGDKAITLSTSVLPNTIEGATGKQAFTTGESTTARAANSFATGLSTIAYNPNQTVIGRFNTTTAFAEGDSIFTVGGGQDDITRTDVFVVTSSGIVLAPSCTTQQLDNAQNSALITKEYIAVIDGGVL